MHDFLEERISHHIPYLSIYKKKEEKKGIFQKAQCLASSPFPCAALPFITITKERGSVPR